jgi:dTDP-4-amino-4,6-dideoxygalactose transaminase
MSIIINIKPEAQAELTRQAMAHGVQPEDYAAALLEEAVHLGAVKKLTPDQLDRVLKELAQFSDKIPLLPDEAFTREGLYQDHD